MSADPDKEARERERVALEVAELRGREAAKLDARLEDYDRRLQRQEEADRAATVEHKALAASLASLAEDFRQATAVAEARAKDAKEVLDRQVTTRTFVLGIIGAVGVISTVLGVTGHV